MKATFASRDAFVAGHRAIYLPKPSLPAVPGVIAEAAATRVVFEVGAGLALLLGIARRTVWTWRKGRGWFQHGTRPAKGERGLMLLRS